MSSRSPSCVDGLAQAPGRQRASTPRAACLLGDPIGLGCPVGLAQVLSPAANPTPGGACMREVALGELGLADVAALRPACTTPLCQHQLRQSHPDMSVAMGGNGSPSVPKPPQVPGREGTPPGGERKPREPRGT